MITQLSPEGGHQGDTRATTVPRETRRLCSRIGKTPWGLQREWSENAPGRQPGAIRFGHRSVASYTAPYVRTRRGDRRVTPGVPERAGCGPGTAAPGGGPGGPRDGEERR